ncbi:hypothetical protein D3C77_748980 [compost metagenome]
MVVIHRPDKQQPVAADQHRGHRQQEQPFAIVAGGAHLRPVTPERDQRQHKEE